MTKVIAITVISVGLLLPSMASCKKADVQPATVNTKPGPELQCLALENRSDVLEWGLAPEGFWAVFIEPNVLEMWGWDGKRVRKSRTAEASGLFRVMPLAGNKCSALVEPAGKYDNWPLVLMKLPSREAIKLWPPPVNHGSYRHFGASANGRFLAVMRSPQDVNPPVQVGLVDVSRAELRWIGELTGHGEGTIRRSAVSDDGRYIAVGGWDNGVALLDASLGKVLWTGRSPTEVSTGYVVFSADGLTLYTAGSEGCVYTTETKTGKIVGQWWATETGKSIYGHRISCLAMSPDGLWLAAGTGPEGHVYLWNTASTEHKPRLLPHGGTTVLVVAFSPDSKAFASVAGGKIKVWSVDPEITDGALSRH